MNKAQKNRLPLAEALADVLPKGKFWEKAWSLVEGCSPKSPGCDNCWLAGMEQRLGAKVEKGVSGSLSEGTATGFETHTPSPLISGGSFNGTIRCREDRLSIPLKRQKPTVYAIWSDLMHEDVPDRFLDLAFAAMAMAPQHWFIIVTKRPEVAAEYLSQFYQDGRYVESKTRNAKEARDHNKFFLLEEGEQWPLKNVIILVTMEGKKRFNQRGPHAMKLAVEGWNVGILAEPLLDEFDPCFDIWPVLPKWVITGGESGHGARPAHPDWFRTLRNQAAAAGVPFMFKQWGEWLPWLQFNEAGVDDDPEQTRYLTTIWQDNGWKDLGHPLWCDLDNYGGGASGPDEPDQIMGRVGKKKAGRLLDGKEHLEVPAL